MQLRGRAPYLRVLILSVVSTVAVLAAVAPASADREAQSTSAGEHCVAAVTSQRSDGELVLGRETCYSTFAEAMQDVTAGTVAVPKDLDVTDAMGDPFLVQLAARFTLGIHYDGYYGTGSSITIVGSSCTGGYWNASSWWKNRINSSYNGCYHLRHYDNPSKSGASFNTYGGGQIDNLSWFANRTESVAYYAW